MVIKCTSPRFLIALFSLVLCSTATAGEVLRFRVYLDDKPMTFAYWDRGFLGQTRLLNAQTGEMEGVSVRQKGREDVEVGSREVPATRYALTTDKLTIDLWYNDGLGWVGLSSDTGKGRRLVYRRM